MISDQTRPGYESCSGCKLCVLPCPVFQQTRDLSLTLMGRARALQGGASAKDVLPSLTACVACGACEPVCPENIDTVGRTLALRVELGGVWPYAGDPTSPNSSRSLRNSMILLPDRALATSKSDLAMIRRALPDAHCAPDHGQDVAFAWESGTPLSAERRARFVKQFEGAREIIVAEGLLVAPLSRALPRVVVRGLGEVLLAQTARSLLPTDFYVIESRAYHANFARLVAAYAKVRTSTGAAMNVDLHRVAIPTGATSLQAHLSAGTAVAPAEQVRWLLEGRKVKRVVCESLADAQIFRDHTELEVLYIGELLLGKAQAA